MFFPIMTGLCRCSFTECTILQCYSICALHLYCNIEVLGPFTQPLLLRRYWLTSGNHSIYEVHIEGEKGKIPVVSVKLLWPYKLFIGRADKKKVSVMGNPSVHNISLPLFLLLRLQPPTTTSQYLWYWIAVTNDWVCFRITTNTWA